jgi:hypothetical protein
MHKRGCPMSIMHCSHPQHHSQLLLFPNRISLSDNQSPFLILFAIPGIRIKMDGQIGFGEKIAS